MQSNSSTPSSDLRVLAVIPARLQSQRLPRKMLRKVAGRPLLAWTYEAARACPQFDQVMVAVDSEEVAALCEEYGWPYSMTSPALQSGTDRLHAISLNVYADIYVNVQGDEPLVSREHIEALLAPFENPAVDVTTLSVPCPPEDIENSNAVKVVTAKDGRALYFSRAPIPFDRDNTGQVKYAKHVGLYAYRRPALQLFASLPPSTLERIEKLEQLRLLENGLMIYVAQVTEASIGVDTEEDLRRLEDLLARRART